MTIKLSLTSVPVFQFLSSDAAARMTRVAKLVEKEPNDAVLLHGETVPGIYVVADGKVGVYPPGATRPLVTLGQGESFGEMSFLERSKASATIRSLEAGTRLVLLTQGELATLIEGDADLGRALFRGMALTLSQKLRATNDKIAIELAAGRKLIKDLSAVDPGETLAALPSDMEQQREALAETLDRLIRLSGELARRNPDRAASLGELEMIATDVRGKCSQSFARLARHVGAIGAFVKTMEDFMAQSHRD